MSFTTGSWSGKLFKSLLLLPVLFSLAACEPDEIENIDPNAEGDAVSTDSFTVTGRTIREVPISGTGMTENILGAYEDPLFGFSEARIAFSLDLPPTDLRPDWEMFTELEHFDDVYLELALTNRNPYGNSDEAMRFRAHVLEERLYRDSSYQTNSVFSYRDIRSGEFSGVPDVDEGSILIELNSSVYDRFLNAAETDFDSRSTLQDLLNGFLMLPEMQGSDGAMYYFDLQDSLTALTFRYNDTSFVRFPVTTQSSRVNLFNHDYDHAVFANQLDGDDWHETLYLQPMSGVKAHIHFPGLKAFAETGNIAIHQAELIVPYQEPSDADAYPVPPRLLVLKSDENLENKEINDLLPRQGEPDYYGGNVHTSAQEYRFRITRHIQETIVAFNNDPDHVDHGMNIIVPASNPAVANRLVVPNTTSEGIRLKLTFSKP